jgi:Phage integrase, N-terminal SAM-like domain
MKGSVYQRGKTWTYRFLAPERDSATGRYPTISKGSYLTEKEAWKACHDAMREADNGRFVRSSTRTVAQLSGEWLPAIEPTVDATTWQNWKDYANAYVLPRIGGERLQRLNEPQLLKFYAALLAEGRVKRDRNSTMYTFWSEQMSQGKSPTPRQVAAAADATIHAARAAVRRFNDGIIPKPSPPGLAPKSVRNIHAMIHRDLVDAVASSGVEHRGNPNVPRLGPPGSVRSPVSSRTHDRDPSRSSLRAAVELRRSRRRRNHGARQPRDGGRPCPRQGRRQDQETPTKRSPSTAPRLPRCAPGGGPGPRS